jgi:hypothetical protein
VNGESYFLREPNVEDTELLIDNEQSGNSLKAFIEFVVRLGMPSEIAKKLSVAQIQMLSQGLSPKMDDKKK